MRLTTVKVFIEVEAEVSVWQLSGSEVEIGPVVLKSKDGLSNLLKYTRLLDLQKAKAMVSELA